jgi:zinc transport system substrate-binding protein
MSKKIILFVFLICFMLGLSACSENKTFQNSNGKIKVAVSFNAMREFAEAVGKDRVAIETIIPDGTEPHDFEPKAKDFVSIGEANVFVYNGLDMENWVDKSLEAVENKSLIVVNASKNSQAIKSSGEYDPHLWISLKGAETEVKNIKDAFIKADATNKDYYEKNSNEYIAKLEALYNEYKQKFNTLSNKNFVTGHAAFAYLCRDFGLNQNSIEDVFAEGEPSAKKLEELTDYCKKNNIKTVFVENMVSPKVSNTLANEVGAKVEKIYTVESKEDNKDYIQSMNYNLEKIYESLK